MCLVITNVLIYLLGPRNIRIIFRDVISRRYKNYCIFWKFGHFLLHYFLRRERKKRSFPSKCMEVEEKLPCLLQGSFPYIDDRPYRMFVVLSISLSPAAAPLQEKKRWGRGGSGWRQFSIRFAELASYDSPEDVLSICIPNLSASPPPSSSSSLFRGAWGI